MRDSLTMDMQQSRKLRTLWSTVAGLVLGAILMTGCAAPYEFNGVEIENQTPAFDIVGVDGENQPFQLSEHRGEYVLVNFGYTFCPDVCPFTLADMSAAYEQLEAENADLSEELAMVFVSVDPERDTPDVLDAYTNAFHKDIYGIYIEDPQALETTKTAYGIFAEKNEPADPENPDNYFVDHSAGIYVIDPDGNFRLFFPYETEVEQMVADLEHLLKG